MCEASIEVVPLHLFCSSVPDVREGPTLPDSCKPEVGDTALPGDTWWARLGQSCPGGRRPLRALQSGPCFQAKHDEHFKYFKLEEKPFASSHMMQ